MSRVQLSVLAASIMTAVASNTGANEGYGLTGITLTASKTSKGDPVFQASLSVLDAGGTVVSQVADDGGKIRTFKDADDFFKAAGALAVPMGDAVVTIGNMEVFDPRPFTGDIIKKNTSIMAGYVKRKAAVDERVTGLTTKITLAGNTPGMVQSVIDELNAQKTSCVALSAWLDSEITRIDDILNP